MLLNFLTEELRKDRLKIFSLLMRKIVYFKILLLADTILMQFGKKGNDTFAMDFQYPLSPLQAFAICLSALDNKYACE